MAISLSKGGNVSLTKTDPNLTKVLFGLGWDPRATDGAEFDLDASVFIVGENGKIRSDKDFIFYNNLKSAEGSVEHVGDNRSGVGDGDDEAVKVNLPAVPADVAKVVFTVTIHEAAARKQNFGQVGSAFIRLVNQETNAEIARYDLAEDYSTETAMIFGELYRNGAEWKFRAVGQGFAGGLAAMCGQFGVNVA
jgi:tellurium resistance protein TerD